MSRHHQNPCLQHLHQLHRLPHGGIIVRLVCVLLDVLGWRRLGPYHHLVVYRRQLVVHIVLRVRAAARRNDRGHAQPKQRGFGNATRESRRVWETQSSRCIASGAAPVMMHLLHKKVKKRNG